MNIQHALLRQLKKSSSEDISGDDMKLHSAGGGDGGGDPDFDAPGRIFEITLNNFNEAKLQGDFPVVQEIKLAGLQRQLDKHLPPDVDPEDPDQLPIGARIELYSIVYKNYRPGPAFRPGHVLRPGALETRISPGGKTWRSYLDELQVAKGGVAWSEHITRIARQCVRLDAFQGEQAGSGFLMGSRILTAGHVLKDLGWPVSAVPPGARPVRVLYNQVHADDPAEAAIHSRACIHHPDQAEDAGLIEQMEDWQAQLDAVSTGKEFAGLAGLEWQDTPLSESELKNRPIAVIGHPLRGNAGGSIADLAVVYGDARLGAKRFMPGFLDSSRPLGQDGMLLKHDCSTLGGASGSCAIDLMTGKVIGIHVSGSVTLHNYLVPMWRLAKWLDFRSGVTITGAGIPAMDAGASDKPPAPETAAAGTRLVIAFGMDDDDIEYASKLMNPDSPDKEGRVAVDSSGGSFVIGEATEGEIGKMTGVGLTVYDLPPISPTAPHLELPAVDQPGNKSIGGKRYLMSLRGPLTPDRDKRLKEHGVRIGDVLPGGSILVDLTPSEALGVARLPFVGELGDVDRLSFESPHELPWQMPLAPPGVTREPALEGPPKKEIYDLLLCPKTDVETFKAELSGNGMEVIGSSGRKVRIVAYERDLEALPQVEVIEQYIPPVLHNIHAARVMRLVAMQDDRRTLPWDGRGQVVAMADTGLDDTHAAFTGRIHSLVDLGRPGLTDDPHGHGTHVAGSILGNGKSSDPANNRPPLPSGIAPGATLYVQSLLGEATPEKEYPLSGLDRIISLEDLFEPAYLAGARVHNNSWGGVAKSLYRLHSQEVDEYVDKRRDMLVVISAGNDGSTCEPPAPSQRFSSAGFVDWYSLCSPATSKNALTVGASRSSIRAGGYSTLSHNDAFGGSFPPADPATTPDISSELVSGDSNDLAGFSSRGPTDTLQIKPDLVAPGTDIVSARSAQAPGRHYSGAFSGSRDYAHMCGTSMAAPLASGCAAVVRQYYQETHGDEKPSAALIKATLINGTRALEGPHANAIPGGFPNGHQGFGCIDMSTTLPASADSFALFYHDNWLAPDLHLSNSPTGRYRDFTFTFDPASGTSHGLRVCLVHTDPPGRGVINVLQVRMQSRDAVGRRTDWYGNSGQQASLSPALPRPFRNNNAAIIRPLNPQAGTYKIRVELINLLKGSSQDFALVVTGTGISEWTRS